MHAGKESKFDSNQAQLRPLQQSEGHGRLRPPKQCGSQSAAVAVNAVAGWTAGDGADRGGSGRRGGAHPIPRLRRGSHKTEAVGIFTYAPGPD